MTSAGKVGASLGKLFRGFQQVAMEIVVIIACGRYLGWW